jgi:hypothetical protein
VSKSNRALVIGVSNYRAPFNKLPAVSADVREIAHVLQSKDGAFSRAGTEKLVDSEATKSAIEDALFRAFEADDTVFVYLAGHGAVEGGEYYFIPYDAQAGDVPGTAVSLRDIKGLFDACKSDRAFLWLDSCHSGGIIARGDSQSVIIDRALKVVQGQGRVILAACSAEQYAYEDASHGMFTGALLRGLKGEAEVRGEVTASSLYDFIDREIGSDHQRPMLYGDMRGRIVLMHYEDRGAPIPTKAQKKKTPIRPVATSKSPKSSSNVVMLGDKYYDAESVKRTASGEIQVSVLSHEPGLDASIQSLKRNDYSRARLPFAHRADACDVEIKSVAAVGTIEGQVWTVALKPVSFENNSWIEMSIADDRRSYTADEVAELRAKAILLNDIPALSRRGFDRQSFLDNSIYCFNNSEAVYCTIRRVHQAHKASKTKWKEYARLLTTYLLKKNAIVEHILKLNIDNAQNGKVAVQFRGRRRARFSNEAPPEIVVEGLCPLA